MSGFLHCRNCKSLAAVGVEVGEGDEQFICYVKAERPAGLGPRDFQTPCERRT
jgi:hypothetical protein